MVINEKLLDNKNVIKLLKTDNNFKKIFIDMHYDNLYRYFLLKGFKSDEALDLVQDTFCKFIDKLKHSDAEEIDSIDAYLYKIAKNCAIDFFRIRTKGSELIKKVTNKISADNLSTDDCKNVMLFTNLLRRLKSVEHDIIIFRIVSGYTFEEVSQILDISISKCKRLFYRAIEKLRILYFSEIDK